MTDWSCTSMLSRSNVDGNPKREERSIECLQGTDVGFTAGILPQKVLRCRTMRSQYRLSKQAHLMCPRTYMGDQFGQELLRGTLSCVASSKPIPLVPPVIKMVLPESSIMPFLSYFFSVHALPAPLRMRAANVRTGPFKKTASVSWVSGFARPAVISPIALALFTRVFSSCSWPVSVTLTIIVTMSILDELTIFVKVIK